MPEIHGSLGERSGIKFVNTIVVRKFCHRPYACDRIGAKNLLGQAYLTLGLLYKTKKESDKAHEFITESRKLFEECEARGFFEQAKDALESM